MTILKIEVNEKRELNEEFFNLIFPGKEIKSEEDFRKHLQEEIQAQWDAAALNLQYDQLYHFLIDLPIDLPEEFLKRWMEIGGKEIKTKEEVSAEFPTFANQLKWTLISDEIISRNNLEVTPDEVKNEIRKEISRYFGQISTEGGEPEWMASYIDRMMKDKKQVDSTYNRIITDKMFQWIASQVTPEVKEISAKEFEALPHHEHHH
jgi:trigger factor